MAACPNCSADTTNPKFCSISCATIFNNTRRPLKEKPCKRCGNPIERVTPWKKRKLCNTCRQQLTVDPATTIGEIKKAAKYQRSSFIRNDARRVYFSSNPKECRHCGYDKHVEVCHKKAIKSFPDDTLLVTVNDPSNLVGLCPNHHWEFDNGLLKI